MAFILPGEIRQRFPRSLFHVAGYSFGGFVAFEWLNSCAPTANVLAWFGFADTLEWHYIAQIRENLDLRGRLALYKSRFDEFLFGGTLGAILRVASANDLNYCFIKICRLFGRSLLQTFGTTRGNQISLRQPTITPRYFRGKVSIFRSDFRPHLGGNDELLGWRQLAQTLEVHDVPGSHHDITREPNVRVLAAKMREALAKITLESSDGSHLDVSSGDAPAFSAQSV